MRKLNLIVVFNKTLDKVLFCIRAKEPYKGMYNFVGGKVEENESNDEAAYIYDSNYSDDISNIINKLIIIVKEIINKMENGEYNSYIEKEAEMIKLAEWKELEKVYLK